MYSTIDTIECIEMLRELRTNLEIPTSAFVEMLPDKECFLRLETSFVQTIGRLSRNFEARIFHEVARFNSSIQPVLN